MHACVYVCEKKQCSQAWCRKGIKAWAYQEQKHADVARPVVRVLDSHHLHAHKQHNDANGANQNHKEVAVPKQTPPTHRRLLDECNGNVHCACFMANLNKETVRCMKART